jgi:Ni/Co efflux regulator RcnB
VRRVEQVERNLQPVQQVGTSQPVRTATTNPGRPGSLADGFRQIGRGEVRHGDGDHDRDWSRDWRNDHRYDWHNHRHHHRSLFRLGRYYDPYGWGYRRWSIGFSLWPSYYGSNYWLNDPWMYRLPPAYGPYRWVRYYDDALLVNIYTGQVVDVIYNFFW